MKFCVALSIAAGLIGSVTTSTAQAHWLAKPSHMTVKKRVSYYKKEMRHAKSTIHFWTSPRQSWRFDGLHPAGALVGAEDLATHRRLYRRAKHRYQVALRELRLAIRSALLPPHYAAWLCIHRYEGAWNAATGNGYYGGLQMDQSFMHSYAPESARAKGSANNWTPLEQMWAAEKAYQSGRGYNPWPNTARYCGLI